MASRAVDSTQVPVPVPVMISVSMLRWRSCGSMSEEPRPGGVGIVFAGQHRLQPFLDQLAPGPLDSGDAGVQRRDRDGNF
jgi:hypothetical protein